MTIDKLISELQRVKAEAIQLLATLDYAVSEDTDAEDVILNHREVSFFVSNFKFTYVVDTETDANLYLKEMTNDL